MLGTHMETGIQSTLGCLTRGKAPSFSVQIRRTRDLPRFKRAATVSALTQTAVKVKQVGKFSVKGTSRKQNEDRLNVLVRLIANTALHI